MNYLIELSDSVARIKYHQSPKIIVEEFRELERNWNAEEPLYSQPFFTNVKVLQIDFLQNRYNNKKAFHLSPADFETLQNGLRDFNSLIKPMTGQQVAEYYADF